MQCGKGEVASHTRGVVTCEHGVVTTWKRFGFSFVHNTRFGGWGSIPRIGTASKLFGVRPLYFLLSRAPPFTVKCWRSSQRPPCMMCARTSTRSSRVALRGQQKSKHGAVSHTHRAGVNEATTQTEKAIKRLYRGTFVRKTGFGVGPICRTPRAVLAMVGVGDGRAGMGPTPCF